MTDGGTSATNGAGSGAGGGGGSAAPDACTLSTGDGASSSSDASGPVGAPPNGYLVYLAETTSLGKQVFHVRLHDGVAASPVRLTPDAGVEGYSVIPQRHAIITATDQHETGFFLTLVDFNESGATGSLALHSSSLDQIDRFSSYGANSDGSLLFASPGIRFFDLRPTTPAPQDLSDYSLTSAYGWSGSRLFFSGTKSSTKEKGWFSADASASPPAATVLATQMSASSGLVISPDLTRAISRSKSSNGDTSWYLLDLTATTTAPVRLTSAALRAPVPSGIAAWSPDSRYYLVQVDPGGLVLLDLEDPSRGQVVSAEGATKFTFASFSPDAQRLVYVASHGGSQTMQLYGVALGPGGPGAAYPLIRGTEEEQEAYVNAPGMLDWLYGSRYVTYWGRNPAGLYLADAYGCTGRRARFRSEQSELFNLIGPYPAPNARRAALFSDYESPGGATDVYVADIDDDGNWGEPTRINVPGGAGLAEQLRFLDGDWLMFYAEDAARHALMYLAPRDGSTPARLLSDPNDAVLYTTWVPDNP